MTPLLSVAMLYYKLKTTSLVKQSSKGDTQWRSLCLHFHGTLLKHIFQSFVLGTNAQLISVDFLHVFLQDTGPQLKTNFVTSYCTEAKPSYKTILLVYVSAAVFSPMRIRSTKHGDTVCWPLDFTSLVIFWTEQLQSNSQQAWGAGNSDSGRLFQHWVKIHCMDGAHFPIYNVQILKILNLSFPLQYNNELN